MSGDNLLDMCFDKTFKIVSIAMHIVRTHPSIKKNRAWRLQFLFLIGLNASCLIFLINSIFLHDAKSGNYMEASKNMAMLIVCCNTNMNFYTMIFFRKSMADLINYIDRDYELAKQFNIQEQNIIRSYVDQAKQINRILVYIAIVTCALFPVKAFCLMSYYYSKGEGQLVPMFEMTFPYFIEQYKPLWWGFVGIFVLCIMFDCYACVVYIQFESLIPIFTLHACGQLKLLSHRISRIISESEDEEEMKEKFRSININVQELYRFVALIQNSFKFLMEFNMKSTTLVLPCNAFLLVEEFRTSNTINVEFLFLTLASLVHFFSPCYFSDLLMESSENFRQAIYSCGWETCRYRSIQKTVLLMLLRVSHPFSINTVFYCICLDTFSTMCRQAYALFNLMTAVWS